MPFPSKFPGRCATCSEPIAVGTMIEWSRETRKARHVLCPTAASREAIASSAAATSERVIPAPAGQEYLPFQRAGIDYVLRAWGGGDAGPFRRGVLIADEMG